MEELPERKSEVMIRRFFLGETLREIGEHIGLSN